MPPEEFSKGDILVINYGLGNIGSLVNALTFLGFDYQVIENRQDFCAAADIAGCIVPGVGAFDHGMKQLIERKLDMLIKDLVQSQVQILGICLGMQIFLTKSYEMGEHKGLNFIEGEVIGIRKQTKKNDLKVPHISWNEIFLNEKGKDRKKINKETLNKSYYFIHSYMASTKNNEDTIAYCKYFDVKVPAVLSHENIIGCQFHPEKSGKNGLEFLKNAINIK